MSSAVTCPKCGKQQGVLESRRRDPKSAVTVGSWRIPYGLVSGMAVLIVGLFAAYVVQTSQDAFFSELALFFAAIALVLAAFILGSTLYITRWVEITEMHCQACGHHWTVQSDVLSGDLP